MKELLPLEVYESADRAATPRTALVMAFLWGLPMTAYLVYARGNLSVGAALGIGAGGALLFGVGWAVWMRTALLKMLRRLHAGDPSLVPPPPEAGYGGRLPASPMDTRVAIGGHLYVGPRAVRFVPHMKNLKMHQAPTEIRLSAAPTVQVVEKTPNAFQRLFRPGPIHLLRVGDSERTVTVLVPTPDDAAKAILACIR